VTELSGLVSSTQHDRVYFARPQQFRPEPNCVSNQELDEQTQHSVDELWSMSWMTWTKPHRLFNWWMAENLHTH